MKKSYVLFSGGLGNQMFQYAFLIALRKKGIHAKMDLMPFDWDKVHNGFELEKVFGIKENLFRYPFYHKYYYLFLKKYAPKKVFQDYLSYYPQVFDGGGLSSMMGFGNGIPILKTARRRSEMPFLLKE